MFRFIAVLCRSDRQAGIELDFAQHDARFHVGDSGQAEDVFVQKRVVSFDVRRHDLEDVVSLARGAVALGHFRTGADFPLELFRAAFGVARELHMRQRAHVQAQLSRSSSTV